MKSRCSGSLSVSGLRYHHVKVSAKWQNLRLAAECSQEVSVDRCRYTAAACDDFCDEAREFTPELTNCSSSEQSRPFVFTCI